MFFDFLPINNILNRVTKSAWRLKRKVYRMDNKKSTGGKNVDPNKGRNLDIEG